MRILPDEDDGCFEPCDCYSSFGYSVNCPCITCSNNGKKYNNEHAELYLFWDLRRIKETRKNLASVSVTSPGFEIVPGFTTEEQAVRMEFVHKICKIFKVCPTRDCFSADHNKRFARFWSAREDALKHDWDLKEVMWVHPP